MGCDPIVEGYRCKGSDSPEGRIRLDSGLEAVSDGLSPSAHQITLKPKDMGSLKGSGSKAHVSNLGLLWDCPTTEGEERSVFWLSQTQATNLRILATTILSFFPLLLLLLFQTDSTPRRSFLVRGAGAKSLEGMIVGGVGKHL